MRKLLYLAVLMITCSVCFGATGASTTTYSQWPAVSDITSYLGTYNAWKAMPSATISAVNATLWGDIYVLDGTGCVFTYDRQSRTYTQKTAWGCGYKEITSEVGPQSNQFEVVGLMKTDANCPSGTLRAYQSTGGANPVLLQVCDKHWRGGLGGAQIEFNKGNTGHAWLYNGAAYVDLGAASWIDGAVFDSQTVCAIKWDAVTGGNTTQVYILNAAGTAMELFSVQPPLTISKGFTGGFTGCIINEDVLMVTDGTKSYMYDRTKLPPPSWQLVTGPASGLTGPSKGQIFGVVSSGLRHLNVYAAYVSASLQSTFTGCPDDTHPCPASGVTHTRTIQIKFPHGINGNLATYAGAPTATNIVTSWDAAPQCDLIFGDHGDPECFAPINGGVNCSVVNNSIYQPPAPPMCHDTSCQVPKNIAESHDARSYDPVIQGYVTYFKEGTYQGKYWAIATAKCEADVPACAPGTPPAPLICPATTSAPPGQNPYFFETADCADVAPYSHCSAQIAKDKAVGQCSFYKHGWGFIEYIAQYHPDDPAGPLCIPLPVIKHFAPPVNYPCHEEVVNIP